ncbi:MAG: molybdenum cofactor guanylyltransferase [Solirubrobacterales bacterium]|nr:molybdenum cofactor guanylyltransferase [Solirubrobacterales bacterium]MCB1009467.1 molybdenum cofactor guanylyltransferase [Acidobacteriota bacterium]MCB8970552.1 molybdenum cofactor guanylyltransferase [Thermoleophilales bacterium]MCO5325713.1 molybdenum cofactor guanylyltransferase [Solirubrobacterales bacterium]
MSPRRSAEGAGDAAPARRAAILAGGLSRRMADHDGSGSTPRSKASLPLAGRPLAAHPIATARLAGLAPAVVAKPDTPLPDLGCPVIDEPATPRHPLAGVVAALELYEEPIVVLACDLPDLPPELLSELAHRRARFAMPVHPRPQPLVARYTPGLLPRLRVALAAEEPLVGVAESLGGDGLRAAELRGFGDPEVMFANVNTPEDLRRAEARLAG